MKPDDAISVDVPAATFKAEIRDMNRLLDKLESEISVKTRHLDSTKIRLESYQHAHELLVGSRYEEPLFG